MSSPAGSLETPPDGNGVVRIQAQRQMPGCSVALIAATTNKHDVVEADRYRFFVDTLSMDTVVRSPKCLSKQHTCGILYPRGS